MRSPSLRLIVKGGVGDVLMHTPGIRAWKRRHPEGRVTVYCFERRDRDVLLGNPHIDSLRLAGPLRRVVSSSRIMRRYLRLKDIVAPSYGRSAPSLFLGVHASRVIADFFDVQLEDVTPELHLTAAEWRAADGRLRPYPRPVAFHTVGRSTGNKNWPLENWAALVRQCPELDFIQLGNRDEPRIHGAIDMRGLPLRAAFAVTGRCHAFVGVDSGPAHAAAALRVPSVVLFGPTTPKVWGYESAVNVSVPQPCSPCFDLLFSGQCPYDAACMRAISVSAVKDALTRAISSRQAGAE